MFLRLGALVVRFRVPIVLAWALAAVLAVALAPSLASVSSSGTADFLPADSPSRAAAERLVARFPDAAQGASATVVLYRAGGLGETDHALAARIEERLRSPEVPAALRDMLTSVAGAADTPELAQLYRSPDGAVELIDVRMSGDPYTQASHAAVDALRGELARLVPPGDPASPEVSLTGTAAIARDYLGAIMEGTDRTTLVTVVLVVAILLLIYRAPVAALVPLVTIGAAFAVARGLLGVLAQAGWRIPSLLDAFIVVLVFGVGTDYAIFLISRLREERLRHVGDRAAVVTVGRIGAVIAASAATVIVALCSMAAGSFGMIQAIGPALAVTVAVTLVAGLTLTPALSRLAGRWLLWPRHEHGLERDERGELVHRDGAWDRLGRAVVQRPGAVSAVVLVLLALPILALPSMNTEFDALRELPPALEARRGFDRVAEHVDRGTLLPVTVLLEAADGADLGSPAGLATTLEAARRLAAVPGVKVVRSLVTPSGGTDAPEAMRPSATLAAMADQLGAAGAGGAGAAGGETLQDPATLAALEVAAGYLDGLAAAYPDLGAGPLDAARSDAGAMRDAVATVQDPSTGTAQRQAAMMSLLGLATRLPGELRAAADLLAVRPDDLYLPRSGVADPTTAWLLRSRLAADGAAAQLTVVTEDEPYSPAAFATVRTLRSVLEDLPAAVAGPGRAALAAASASGPTPESADVQQIMGEDFRRVGLITIVGILVVLALLLRSLVAPLYLVGTVLLSYATTLGLSTFLFQSVLGQGGVDFFIPLIVFVLLVALGSDYNIFLMSRVREESTGADLRAGIAVASARTGTVITSAGIILAGTFAALVVAPVQILQQAGIAVAMGVLIDTFVVRSLLIPALTALIGERAWWPSRRPGAVVPPAHPTPPVAG